jgi:hypothetical protein
MKKLAVNTWLVAGVLLTVCSALGCGSKRYEDRLQETVKRLGQESAFSGMRPAVQLPGTPVMVQLPRFLAESPLPEDSDARRLKPPLIEIPDLKSTYEGFVTDSDVGKQHYYCYLAATKKDPQRQLQQQLLGVFPDAAADWKPVDCERPGGGTVQWKLLQGSGPQQEFYYVDKGGQASYRRMPAEVRLYVRQVGDLFVVVGWRLPTTLGPRIGSEKDLGVEKWAQRVAGGVTLKE